MIIQMNIMKVMNKYDYYIFCKMETEDYIKMVDHIALLIAIIIFLVIKFLKYLTSRERTNIKKLSVFNSIESPSSK